MKAYWESGGIAPHTFSISVLDGGEWLVSRPNRFTPGARGLGTLSLGSWVGPRAGLDTVVKRKFPVPARTRTSDHPAGSPALYR
jgi:hypothetical protein